jgi:hypothetical protein
MCFSSHRSLFSLILFISIYLSSRLLQTFFPVSVRSIISRFLTAKASCFARFVKFMRINASLIKFYLISASNGVSVEKLGV